MTGRDVLVALVAVLVMSCGVAVADDVAEANTFGGVGLIISQEPNDAGEMAIRVTGLTEGSAAGEAGVQAGDLITHIGGNAVAGLEFTEVVERLRGEPGTKVMLTVARAGQDAPLDFEVTRRGLAAPGGLAAERAEGIAQVAQAQGGREGPFALGVGGPGGRMQFVGMGAGGEDADMVATEAYLFVLRGYMLKQFKADGMVMVWERDLRTAEEKELAERRVFLGRGGSVAQLTVQEPYLYVLRGHMLHQFRIEDMLELAASDLRSAEEKEQQAQMIQRMQQMQQNPPQFEGRRGGRGERGGADAGGEGR